MRMRMMMMMRMMPDQHGAVLVAQLLMLLLVRLVVQKPLLPLEEMEVNSEKAESNTERDLH